MTYQRICTRLTLLARRVCIVGPKRSGSCSRLHSTRLVPLSRLIDAAAAQLLSKIA